MTRAPRSASIIVQNGPASTRDRSTTRTPSRGDGAVIAGNSLMRDAGSGSGSRSGSRSRRMPAQRPRQEVEEPERRDLHAIDALRDGPVLFAAPQEVRGRV